MAFNGLQNKISLGMGFFLIGLKDPMVANEMRIILLLGPNSHKSIGRKIRRQTKTISSTCSKKFIKLQTLHLLHLLTNNPHLFKSPQSVLLERKES
ncbi:MAG TPA: hypothetical protein DCR42_01025 [Flavobacteriaceae bacterium]|nr:hypothetical protein [Flavobacteriaceae bacterium]